MFLSLQYFWTSSWITSLKVFLLMISISVQSKVTEFSLSKSILASLPRFGYRIVLIRNLNSAIYKLQFIFGNKDHLHRPKSWIEIVTCEYYNCELKGRAFARVDIERTSKKLLHYCWFGCGIHSEILRVSDSNHNLLSSSWCLMDLEFRALFCLSI